jgi:signal recognition particle receptor subunit beta
MEKFEVQSEWSVDGIKELQSNEKEELVNVLDTQERGVNSDLIDLNNFSDL